MSVRLALHARGGPGIGVGHLVRCLALAEEAVARGWTVGIEPPVGVDWLRTEFDALGVASGQLGQPDVVLADSYTDAPAPGSALVVNIEDGTFGRRRADIVVDPNLASSPRPADGSPILLRGPEYALVRRKVRSARRGSKPTGLPLKVAITLGGSTLAAPVVAELLDRLADSGLPLHCTVFGELDCPDWVRVRPPTPDLPVRLAAADLVCAGAGITLLEGCCIGTPLAIICLVDNQEVGYQRAVELGLATGLGHPGELLPAETLAEILSDRAGLAERAARARNTVDGAGADRILDTIERRLH